MRRIIAILPLYFLPSISATAADNLSLYSDVCYNVEGGDILGYRMGIMRLSDATYVFLQAAEGDWAQPLIGKASASDLKQRKLVFTLANERKLLSFRGTITEKAVTGQFDGLFGPHGKPLVVRLPRIAVSMKGAPNCR